MMNSRDKWDRPWSLRGDITMGVNSAANSSHWLSWKCLKSSSLKLFTTPCAPVATRCRFVKLISTYAAVYVPCYSTPWWVTFHSISTLRRLLTTGFMEAESHFCRNFREAHSFLSPNLCSCSAYFFISLKTIWSYKSKLLCCWICEIRFDSRCPVFH